MDLEQLQSSERLRSLEPSAESGTLGRSDENYSYVFLQGILFRYLTIRMTVDRCPILHGWGGQEG